MRKPIALIALLLVILVGLYAAVGTLLAPRWIARSLIDLAAQQQLRLRLTDVRVDPFALQLDLRDITLSAATQGASDPAFARARNVHVDLAWSSLWRRAFVVDALALQAPWLDVARLPATGRNADEPPMDMPALIIHSASVRDGELLLPGVPPVTALQAVVRDVATEDAMPGHLALDARFADGEVHAEGTIALHERTLHDLRVHAAGLRVRGVGLEQLEARIPQAAWPLQRPVPFEAQAAFADGGTVAAAGELVLPLLGTVGVEIHDVPLRLASPWLPAGPAVHVASGTVSADGSLNWSEAAPTFDGSVVVEALRVESRDDQRLLLAWEQARAHGVHVQVAPLQVALRDVHVDAPAARLVREADGRINVLHVVDRSAGPAGERSSAAPQVEVGQLSIARGRLEFADRALATPFEARFEDLSGEVRGFSTGAGEPARLSLDGRVARGGTVRIEGEIDLDRPRSQADVAALVRDLRLAPMSPYAARFAGYRIAAGRMSARLAYRIDDGRLSGSNEVVIERLRLGEKLEDRGLLDVPLDLAVALLADANGCIDLHIPVRGRVDDPEIDVGSLVVRALGDAMRGAVTAPLRALAGAFGEPAEAGSTPSAGAHVGAIRFAPGVVDLPSSAPEQLARLAQLLRERPGLRVRVNGGHSPAVDRDGLRLQAIRREVAIAANLADPSALDASSPAVVQAAERLYLRRAGSLGDLLRWRGQPDYLDRLLQRLAGTVPTGDVDTATLAELRARRVQAALVDRGIEPARIQLETRARRADSGRVPTALSLVAPPASARAGVPQSEDAGPKCPSPA